MSEAPRTLRRERPGRLDVPVTAGLASALLLVGVTLPAMTFDNLVGDDTFSVLSGIWGFVTSGNLLLALLLFGFSVLFPAVKLGAILALWFVPMSRATRREVVEWLEVLGKWSLLDAFVIAVLIGTVQLGILSVAVAEPGVYVYLAAIVLSLVATFLLRPLVFDDDEAGERGATSRLALLLTMPAAVCYGLGMSLPLLSVEKGWWWENRFSLLEGIAQLLRDGDHVLAYTLVLFVVALPTLRFVGLIALRVVRPADARWTRWLRVLDRWSMAEVFVLALLVVLTKLGSLATPEPLAGMWLLLASAGLTAVDSFVLHRRGRRSGA
ncbi:MAG: paraquat-inducible protein A [Planctomycetes bacterium]|nr:paraquat-inducible protein A [Planctomycetota bacterium]